MTEDATALHEFFLTHASEPGSVRAALGPRIRRARVERLRGMNLEEFGRRIAEAMERKRAFSNVTISNWETGRQEPSFEALVAIACLTCLPLYYFAGVGEMDDYPHIDWLAPGDPSASRQLLELFKQLDALTGWKRALALSQVKSLLSDLHRLSESR
jgi:transcriptional regulator with XRE-family HTH domain